MSIPAVTTPQFLRSAFWIPVHEKVIFPQVGVARRTLESLGAARSSLETPYAAWKWVNR